MIFLVQKTLKMIMFIEKIDSNITIMIVQIMIDKLFVVFKFDIHKRKSLFSKFYFCFKQFLKIVLKNNFTIKKIPDST